MNDVDMPFKGSDGKFYQSLEARLLQRPMKLPKSVLEYLQKRRDSGYVDSDEAVASFVAQFDGKLV